MLAVSPPSILSLGNSAHRAGCRWAARFGAAVLLAVGGMVGSGAFAASTHSDKERAEDVTRHKAMAAAHEAAARCLEAGKDENQCLGELQAACKGLGIGKYCGMKHVH
ncbi:hypothetical protein GCM10028785_21580 [Hydrogenophaga soli]